MVQPEQTGAHSPLRRRCGKDWRAAGKTANFLATRHAHCAQAVRVHVPSSPAHKTRNGACDELKHAKVKMAHVRRAHLKLPCLQDEPWR
eukprot:1151449-Pelagomonas_calceolata.AAC.4